MPNSNVRISEQSYKTLKSLAKDKGESMQIILDQAIEDLRRKTILHETNAAYQALRDNPEEWQAELEERKIWEGTLADGLDS
jgi:hypothetical protein